MVNICDVTFIGGGGGGGSGVWKGYICGDVINRQPLICFTD